MLKKTIGAFDGVPTRAIDRDCPRSQTYTYTNANIRYKLTSSMVHNIEYMLHDLQKSIYCHSKRGQQMQNR